MSSRFWMALAVVLILSTSCQKQLREILVAPLADSLYEVNDSIFSPLGGLIWWSHPTDMPLPSYFYLGAEHQQGFAINGKGYLVGGTYDFRIIPSYWAGLNEYDPATNSWTEKSDFPGGDNTRSCNFVIGTRAYMMIDNQCWCYDQPTDTWTQKATLPATTYYQRQNASAFAIRGKGYVGFGLDYEGEGWNYQKDWWEYDPSTDKWTQKKDFPGTARSQAPAFAVGDYGYICGDNDLWQYNPSRDTWIQKANAPTTGLTNGIGLNGVVDGGVPLGFIVQGIPHGCLQYNPATDHWTILPDVPGYGRSNFSGFMVGRSLYVAGGDRTSGDLPPYEFDVEALNWSK